MRRILPAVIAAAALLGWAAPQARADLCDKCKDGVYIMSIGQCVVCGNPTGSGAFQLCKACSAQLNQCEHCRAPLGPAKPPGHVAATQPAKINPDVAGQYEWGLWEYTLTVDHAGDGPDAHFGQLSYNASPVAEPEPWDYMPTPWGMMLYLGPKPEKPADAGWLLRLPGDKPLNLSRGRRVATPIARQHAADLKADLAHVSIDLAPTGAGDKPYLALYFTTNPAERSAGKPTLLHVNIPKGQASKIIDHLAAEGFIEEAQDVSLVPIPTKNDPGYRLSISGGTIANPVALQLDMGWNLQMLQRLDRLKTVLEGDSADALAKLLARLDGARKEWSTPGTGGAGVSPVVPAPKGDGKPDAGAVKPPGG